MEKNHRIFISTEFEPETHFINHQPHNFARIKKRPIKYKTIKKKDINEEFLYLQCRCWSIEACEEDNQQQAQEKEFHFHHHSLLRELKRSSQYPSLHTLLFCFFPSLLCIELRDPNVHQKYKSGKSGTTLKACWNFWSSP